jgi:hypothetical protein
MDVTTDRGALPRLRKAFPIADWLPGYPAGWLRADVVAGVTLAAYVVPQSMAYAPLAGLPPETGLYCYLLAGAAYVLFGTSRPTTKSSVTRSAFDTAGGDLLAPRADPTRGGAARSTLPRGRRAGISGRPRRSP